MANRVVYFNFLTITIYSFAQLAFISSDSVISVLTAVLVIPFLLYWLISLRYDKPKYTFLYFRKLLIAAAVVLS